MTTQYLHTQQFKPPQKYFVIFLVKNQYSMHFTKQFQT